MFRKPFFGQINRQMMQKVVDFQQPAYHITKSIPFWSVLEEACPYTGRSKRVLPIIRWVQEHAGEAQSFSVGRAGWRECAFPGESSRASRLACFGPQSEDFISILLYKGREGTPQAFWEFEA